jgi:hypothetical protein
MPHLGWFNIAFGLVWFLTMGWIFQPIKNGGEPRANPLKATVILESMGHQWRVTIRFHEPWLPWQPELDTRRLLSTLQSKPPTSHGQTCDLPGPPATAGDRRFDFQAVMFCPQAATLRWDLSPILGASPTGRIQVVVIDGQKRRQLILSGHRLELTPAGLTKAQTRPLTSDGRLDFL